MIFVGLIVASAVSLASFLLMITTMTPQGGMLIIGLFFLTFFLALTSLATMIFVLVERFSASTRRFSDGFRNGIFIGVLGILLLALGTRGLLTF